jgi:hypothetical protein
MERVSRVVLAEYTYVTPLTGEQRAREQRALADCLEVREAKRVRTYLSADGSHRISVFEAADAEAVRYAHRSAGIAFQAVWPADESD